MKVQRPRLPHCRPGRVGRQACRLPYGRVVSVGDILDELDDHGGSPGVEGNSVNDAVPSKKGGTNSLCRVWGVLRDMSLEYACDAWGLGRFAAPPDNLQVRVMQVAVRNRILHREILGSKGDSNVTVSILKR